MQTRIAIALGVLLCLTAACSRRDFLTRRLAADLISGSAVFNAPQVFWLKTGTASNQEFNSPDSLVLQRRGWIIGIQKECPANVQPPPCWDVVLSPAGVDIFRPLIHDAPPSDGLVSLKVARRELVGITGISKAGNFADVEFTWHWISMNEVGAALYDSGVHYRSTTAFRSYDDGWRVVAEPARSNQLLDEALRNPQPVP
jgi:hypothetical protein